VTDLKPNAAARVRIAADSLYSFLEFSDSAGVGTAEKDGAGA